MRRTDRQIDEAERLWDILRSAEVCRVAFCSENWPYIVPMNFGCGDESLYFHCATEGTKLDLLQANANVCFEVEANVKIVPSVRPCDWSVTYQSVIGFGRAVLIKDTEEKKLAMRALLAQYAGAAHTVDASPERTDRSTHSAPPISSDVILFRIEVLSLTGKESVAD